MVGKMKDETTAVVCWEKGKGCKQKCCSNSKS